MESREGQCGAVLCSVPAAYPGGTAAPSSVTAASALCAIFSPGQVSRCPSIRG